MNTSVPLVLAGHGTRDLVGVAACHELIERVRALLPGVRVEAGFVELTPPTIEDALGEVLGEGDEAVVVPLMIGTGGHVRSDIPGSIDIARGRFPDATVVYTRHLGSPAPLVAAVHQRIAAAWDEADSRSLRSAEGRVSKGRTPGLRDSLSERPQPPEVTVVMVGRGTTLTDANADHVRLCRLVEEDGGYARVVPGFIQLARPSLPDALDEALAGGANRIVVLPHFLFPGRLRTWVREQSAAWQDAHPDIPLAVADVIGPCDELARVVVQRYREGALRARAARGSDAYLTGLLLAGRKVVVVGGGCVARRRVPKLLAAGAEVTLVAPAVHERLAGLAAAGEVTWQPRGFVPEDLESAWYVLAATNDPATNAVVAAEAERRHTFCVRSDLADGGSAWTPATGEYDGVTVAAITGHDPGRSRRIRDRLVTVLAEEAL